jgi:hypothetical protein
LRKVEEEEENTDGSVSMTWALLAMPKETVGPLLIEILPEIRIVPASEVPTWLVCVVVDCDDSGRR